MFTKTLAESLLPLIVLVVTVATLPVWLPMLTRYVAQWKKAVADAVEAARSIEEEESRGEDR